MEGNIKHSLQLLTGCGSVEGDGTLKFVYNEPALVINDGDENVLVVGDLHVGAEAKLSDKGVHIYGTGAGMAKRIASTAEEFSARRVILLGDVKDTILYPTLQERRSLSAFFEGLSGLKVTVVAGNHDAHLDEIVDIMPVREVLLDEVALLHGNTWPSEDAVMRKYIVTAHNHIAVSMRDKNGAFYREKAWLIAPPSPTRARRRYSTFKAKRLIVMPAYNDLIVGMPVNELSSGKENINPLLRNGIFRHGDTYVYTLRGDYLGKVSELVKRGNVTP